MTILSFGTAGDTQLTAGVYAAHWLAELDFAAPIGTLRYTTLPVDRTIGGQVYSGVGGNVSISPVRESEDASAEKVTVSIAIVDEAMLAAALGPADRYRNRQIRLYLQIFDGAFVAMGSPVLRWQGYMDPVRVKRDGQGGRIELPCSRAGMARSRNAQGLRVTHAQWVRRYPGERGLEYLQTLINQPVTWLSKRFQEQP